jgi:hypothetical protein
MPVDVQRHEQALKRLDAFSRLTDSHFRIPFTSIRFGIDPLIGLIPVLGDLIGLLLSLPILVEAIRIGAPKRLVGRMLFNALLEFVIGLVPVLGDAFDVYFKANTRNTALLRAYIHRQLYPPAPKPQRFGWLAYVVMLLWLALIAGLVYLFVSQSG